MPEHAQSPTVLHSSHPTTLLSLPDEILLEVIAHVPYTKGKSLIALKRVNHQLLGLLTDESSLSQLRRLIVKVQYSYCLAFRIAKDEPSFGELDRMDAPTTIINRVFSWMENLYPVVENNNNPHNKAHLLHIGLHLFFAIYQLGLDVASEYETALFLTKLGTPATALLRLTSTRVGRCLQELAKQFGRELQQNVLSLPVIFSVIDTMLVRGGLHVIDRHLSSEAPGSLEIKTWRYVDMLLDVELSRRRHTPNFSMALIAFEAGKDGKGNFTLPAVPLQGRPSPFLGDVLNNILVLDCCRQEDSAIDFAAVWSSYLEVEYESVRPLRVTTQPNGWVVTAPAPFQNSLPDFKTADWYAWVAGRFPSILEAALKKLSAQQSDVSVLQAVGTRLKNAVAARNASVPEAQTVYRNLGPHCTLLLMRGSKLQQSQK